MTKRCSTRSNVMVNVRPLKGRTGVIRPCGTTLNAMFQKWLTRGVSARQIFPAICVYMCSVSRVSRHDSSGSAGQSANLLPASDRRLRHDGSGHLEALPVLARQQLVRLFLVALEL